MKCVEFNFVGNLLKTIIFFPNYTITLQDTVEYFGPPTEVSLYESAQCLGCGISFSWDDRRISVSVLDTRCSDGAALCKTIGHGGKIPPDYVVEIIGYYSQAWIGYNSTESLPWPGFEETVP